MNEYLVKILRDGRNKKGLKQSEVADLLGVKGGTLSNYENGVSEPDIDTFASLCEIYGLDFANVLGEAYGMGVVGSDFDIKPSEIEHIKKYRSLDSYGQETVSYILDRETVRVKSLQEQTKYIETLKTSVPEDNPNTPQMRMINYYYRLASAGTGQIIFDMPPTKRIEIPDILKYKKADYAIGVNGNSMEPVYYDGDMLLVEMTENIEVGEIGIFSVNNECFVKKLGKNDLISLNPDYDNIPLNETAHCMGRVIDKL